MFELGKNAVLATYSEDRHRAWGRLSKRAARESIDAMAEADEVDYPTTAEAVEQFLSGVKAGLAVRNPARRRRW